MAIRMGGPDRSIPPDTGTDLTATTATTFTWTVHQDRVRVVLHPDSTATIYLRWNGTDALPASTTTYDEVMRIGNLETIKSPYGLKVKTLNIYSSANQTFGTHFTVRGFA